MFDGYTILTNRSWVALSRFLRIFLPTLTYENASAEEKSVINYHIFQNATRCGVSVEEDQKRLPSFYRLPKLHKQPHKSRFIANSSSCTTTGLSKLLTSCLTTIKNHVIKYCSNVNERSGKNLFWSINIHVRL